MICCEYVLKCHTYRCICETLISEKNNAPVFSILQPGTVICLLSKAPFTDLQPRQDRFLRLLRRLGTSSAAAHLVLRRCKKLKGALKWILRLSVCRHDSVYALWAILKIPKIAFKGGQFSFWGSNQRSCRAPLSAPWHRTPGGATGREGSGGWHAAAGHGWRLPGGLIF